MEDILLITVDALRADRTRFLGYDRNTTPALDDLAEESLVYEQAFSYGPTTFTSFPSILTGTHAYQSSSYPELSGRTVGECAQKAGYHTASVSSNLWISPTYGYDTGFDSVHALGIGPELATGLWDNLRHKIGNALSNGAVFQIAKTGYDLLRSDNTSVSTENQIHHIVMDHIDRDYSTFTWAHYITTHAPYRPDPETDLKFARRHPADEAHRHLIRRARQSPKEISQIDRELLSDLYDDAVSHVDRRIEDLVSEVNFDETVVCITTDHSEGFFKRGYYEHTPELHQQLIHVPLLIRAPNLESRRISESVGLESIPAILATLGEFSAPDLPLCAPFEKERQDPICSAVAHASRVEPETIDCAHLKVSAQIGESQVILADGITERPDSQIDVFT